MRSATAAPDDQQSGQPGRVHPAVVLGLADRAAHDLHQRHRVAPLPARLLAAEDDQVLGVAAGAGGQVVELEQQLQLVRVLLLALGLVQHLELAVHDDLAAVRDVQEHRR